MTSEMQPSPVVFFPPAERGVGDFRPRPVTEAPEETEADPKDLFAPESAPSSPSVEDQKIPTDPPSPAVIPVTIAPVAKVNSKPKDDGPSTQTS